MDDATMAVIQKLGLSGGGLVGIFFIIWQIYSKIRSQLKEDSKGDKLDQRYDSYSDRMQKTIDQLSAKLDEIQKTRDEMVVQSAKLQADLMIARAEIEDLKSEADRQQSRVSYLEKLLTEKGITYAQ